ncbi:MAG: ABC transporter substrate-binding protein [Armatimonadetes bacterium]|nr:ABC transporter substrate-binding protein [Armatimonadota bacterium]
MRKLFLLGLAALLFIIGCEKKSDSIKIGAIYNLEGSQMFLDFPSSEGAKLAINELNKSGGILGKKLELILLDGKTDIPTIKAAANQLVQEDKVSAIIGFSDTDMVLAAAPIAAEAKVVFITSGATSPRLPQQVQDYLFLACFGDNVQAAAGADYAFNTLNLKTSYLLIDTEMEFTLLLAKYFKECYLDMGGEIILEDTYKGGSRDFSEQIEKLKSLDVIPDMLYISSGPDDIGFIIKQFREAGIETPIIGADGFDTPLLTATAGNLAENVFFATHYFAEEDKAESDLIKNFIKSYKTEYGTVPGGFAALGYDSVMLLANAIKNADSINSEAIRSALLSTKDFQGVTGKISYENDSRIPDKGVTIVEVKDSKFHFITSIVPQNVPLP